jgi:hypothetical protein
VIGPMDPADLEAGEPLERLEAGTRRRFWRRFRRGERGRLRGLGGLRFGRRGFGWDCRSHGRPEGDRPFASRGHRGGRGGRPGDGRSGCTFDHRRRGRLPDGDGVIERRAADVADRRRRGPEAAPDALDVLFGGMRGSRRARSDDGDEAPLARGERPPHRDAGRRQRERQRPAQEGSLVTTTSSRYRSFGDTPCSGPWAISPSSLCLGSCENDCRMNQGHRRVNEPPSSSGSSTLQRLKYVTRHNKGRTPRGGGAAVPGRARGGA